MEGDVKQGDAAFDDRVDAFRKEFPHLGRQLYLNHGRLTPIPKSVREAADAGTALTAERVYGGAAEVLTEAVASETRAVAGRLLGVEAEDIALVSNTSTALSLVACAIPWRAGDRVVTSVAENPAQVVPWLNLAEAGVEVMRGCGAGRGSVGGGRARAGGSFSGCRRA